MKATLSFELPEEREEFEAATKGSAYKATLTDLDNYLRSRLKYEDLPEDVHDAIQKTRDKLTSLCEENGTPIYF
jgi:hypothetical protein